MSRRQAGAVLVAIVVIASVVVPAVFGIGLTGRAAGPDPWQPRTGDCVVQYAKGVFPVACSGRHMAEVVDVLDPDTVETTGVAASRAGCTAAVERFVGEPSSKSLPDEDTGWINSPLNFSAVLTVQSRVAGPTAARLCLVRPVIPTGVGGYLGTLGGLAKSGDAPVDLLPCFGGGGLSFTVPCSEPHSGEILSARELPIALTDLAANPDLHARYFPECARLAGSRIGVADPTFAGQLSVRLDLEQIGRLFASSTTTTTVTPVQPTHPSANPAAASTGQTTAWVFRLTCSVTVSGSQSLTGSITGLNGRTLPLS